MNLAAGRLAVAPGSDGLVCRTAGAVLFVSARTPADDVARLLDTVRGEDGAEPGRHLARRLASLVAADESTTLPGFALVATSTQGLYVKAYGSVEIHLQGDDGEQVISAVGSLTGVDRELAGPVHTVAAHRAGEPAPAPAFDVDMQAGTSPGAGFALTTLASPTDAGPVAVPEAPVPAEPVPAEPVTVEPVGDDPPEVPVAEGVPAPEVAAEAPPSSEVDRPATDPLEVPTGPWPPPSADDTGAEAVAPPPAPEAEDAVEVPPPPPPPVDPPAEAPPAPEPATPEPPPYEPATLPSTPVGFTSQLLGALDDGEPEEREALPLETDPADLRAPDQGTVEVVVQGVICSRGHFNDPRSRFCSSCGISMVQNTQVLTSGPRPPLGVVVFEDGATFSLSTDYVVGRQPESSELVQNGDALPLTVDDPERSISRAHAELRLVDWDVHLVNLSETNGSFVWDPTSNQWIPIPAGQSVMLTPGMRVALGRRSAVFESSLVN